VDFVDCDHRQALIKYELGEVPVATRNRRLIPVALAVLTAALGIATPAHAEEGTVETVVSITENADGTTTERIFTPAPDVTPTELAQSLTASGVPNVVVRTESEIEVQAAACKTGTARTWPSSATCFVRWAKKGQPRPIIHFLDRTSAAWPVGRAVTEWNKVSGIDSIRRTPAGGCLSSAHCVEVVSANYGKTGWIGETWRHLNDAATYHTNVAVYLNDYYADNETERWIASCHELGHALGLDHNTSKGSCMYEQLVSGMSKYPSANDRALIERFY
jgi:Matrixin